MNKVFGMIGLAKKAGKIICGEAASKDSVRYGRSFLVIIAEDASDNTSKSITDSCKYYNVPYFIYGTKDTLGKAAGNEFNAVLSVTDRGFAGSIEKCLQANINGGE